MQPQITTRIYGGANGRRKSEYSSDELSQGTSVDHNKGPVITTCNDPRSSTTHLTYRLQALEARTKEKLIVKLDQVSGVSTTVKSFGAAVITQAFFSNRTTFHGQTLTVPDIRVYGLEPSNWQHKISDLMHNQEAGLLLAQTGLGKTLKIPYYIATTFSKIVYLVEPTSMLAKHVYYAYSRMGHAVVYDSGGELNLSSGMVIIGDGTQALVRMTMQSFPREAEVVYYLDESHSMTPVYEVIRAIVPNLHSNSKIVMATATHSEKESAKRDSLNSPRIATIQIPRHTSMEWVTGSVFHGWESSKIQAGRWLFLLPNTISVMNYMKMFVRDKVSTYLVSEQFSESQNEEHISRFNASNRNVTTVLLATSAFGYGFNFDCDFIVDSGYTEELVYKDAVTSMQMRTLTKSEVVQRIGRAGRFGRAGKVFTHMDLTSGSDYSPDTRDFTQAQQVYLDLWCSLLELRIYNRNHRFMVSAKKAQILIGAKCHASLLLSLVGESGGIHYQFSKYRKCIFTDDQMPVDATIDSMSYQVHADVVKKTFMYHYDGEFVQPQVSIYGRFLMACIDFEAIRPSARIDDVFKPKIQYRDTVVQPHVDVNLGSGKFSTSDERNIRASLSQTSKFEAKPLRLSSVSMPELHPSVDQMRPKAPSHIDDNDTSSEEGSMVTNSPPFVFNTSIQSENKRLRPKETLGNRDFGGYTTAIIDTPVQTGRSHAHSKFFESLERVTNQDDTLKKSYERIRESSSSRPTGEIISVGQPSLACWTYEDYQQALRNIIRPHITLYDNMFIPYMTIFQETTMRCPLVKDATPPMGTARRVREIMRGSLDQGFYYTPLLSLQKNKNYMECSDQCKSDVQRFLRDPSEFIKNRETILNIFDKFVCVWNMLSVEYASIVTKLQTLEDSEVSRSIFASIFNRNLSRTSLTKRLRHLSERQMEMTLTYENVFKKHKTFVVPYKSKCVSSSSYDAIRDWIDEVDYETKKHNSESYSSFGWRDVTNNIFYRDFAKHLVRVEATNDGSTQNAQGFRCAGDVLYTVRHIFEDTNSDLMACTSVDGFLYDLTISGKMGRTYTPGPESVIDDFEVLCSHRVSDLIRAKTSTSKEIVSDIPRPRSAYTETEHVIILATIEEEGRQKVFVSRKLVAHIDLHTYTGFCVLEVPSGCSGAVVVSIRDNSPIGLVKGLSYSRKNDPIMIFSTFTEAILNREISAKKIKDCKRITL